MMELYIFPIIIVTINDR